MTVAEINPFIRYAYSQFVKPTQFFTCSYDHRMLYLQHGSLIFHYDGGVKRVSEGSLMIWHSGMRYRFEVSEVTSIIILNFDFTQEHSNISEPMQVVKASEFLSDKVLENAEIDDCAALSELIVFSDMKYIENELMIIVREMREKRKFYRETSSAILKRIICDVARGTFSDNRGTIDRVIAFIRANYSSRITNREIAENVNYHEYYVNKLMLDQTGMTIHQYLLNFRLQSAEKLLLTTDQSVSRIAELSGFTSSAYFISAFRKKFGETPNEYRRRSGLI